MDVEPKIWLPESARTEKQAHDVGRFEEQLRNLCEQHKIGAMYSCYVNYADPRKGRILLIGQPTAKWLDAVWMRMRLHASGLISDGKVK